MAEAVYAVEPIVAIFGDNLTTVKFVRDGHVIDPRHVLTGLAKGHMTVSFEQNWYVPDSPLANRYLVSETLEIVPRVSKR